VSKLSAERILAGIEDKTGRPDPETWFRPNLDALVDALNRTGGLSDDARAMAESSLIGRGADRVEGIDWAERFPEIAEEIITAPVFMTGLPRSGTTYFQYLMDRDRRFRLIRTWEAIMPNPPPGHDPASVAGRKAKEREINAMIAPKIKGFDALHLIDEDGPQECHVFMEQSWSAAGFMNLYDVPDYFDFLMGSLDLAAAYRTHKRQLQLLQWKCPQMRWALKYPNHVIAMDQILSVYPDARFVMTHRDPVQILPSIAKMSLTLRSARQAEPVDPHRVGRQMIDFVRRHIDRIMAFCTGPQADKVTHVDYYRLVDDPVSVMPEIHTGIGADTPEDVRADIAAWRAANPKGKRGKNPYSLEQFGIREEEARDLFADYIAHFDIPTEAQGTGNT
jgi:hypothetical protein